MKKLIVILILLIAVQIQAQDTVKKFIKIVDFGKQTQIKYECIVFSNGDTICKETARGMAQGLSDSTKTELSDNEKEILYFLNELQKIDDKVKEIQNNANKQLAELEASKQQLIGVLTYTSKKYGIDINELIKKLR